MKRYKDLSTDLNAVYDDIKYELQTGKELNVVKEQEGTVNGIAFKSIFAVRESVPKALLGTLREVTVTLTGGSDDWMLEVHTGAWFSNMVMPGTGGLLIAGPIGGIAASGTATIYAVKFERDLKNKVKDIVKKHSKKPYTEDKVETF
ncbi:hypothetical protein JXL21_11465 [Candidatus Bathyarchaeota archaeon]|nr:hypothetical protein [Candidatus Bathyarchaeota archaeon]